MEFPRLIIAALRGGSGKTILSIGIISALNGIGKSIAPFKKGPDYIDAGWLALAAGRPCFNLDTFLLSENVIRHSFFSHSSSKDIAVIEGNRGLFDGIDLEGSTSTAELAKFLKAPVLMCVDCTKTTRTMAAIVSGCKQFDPDVMIKGVILNRVAGARHENILRTSIEEFCGIPVLGAIPKLGQQHFPERHLGLVPTPEHDWALDSISAVSRVARKYLDLDAIVRIAGEAPEVEEHRPDDGSRLTAGAGSSIEVQKNYEREDAQTQAAKPVIGILRDSAFQFYYPENIEALTRAGAKTIFISPLKDKDLPELDGLYIGGGFPETHAEQLAQNRKFADQLKSLADRGFPIYAECGGLMYLGQELILEGKSYPMTGILPVAFDFHKKPQGHGYTVIKVEKENPYYPVGAEIKGHEFHYSRVVKWSGVGKNLVFRMQRGAGIDKDLDGLLYKNVLATYTHIHALGTPSWSAALVRNALAFNRNKNRVTSKSV